MMTNEVQIQNQSQQSTAYDECVFNEPIHELFNSNDSTFMSSTNNNIKQMTSIVDPLFPEETSFYHQKCDQCRILTNGLITDFDQSTLCNNNNSSASAFCGETTNGSSLFANRHQSTLNSSSHLLINTHHHQQQRRDRYRSPPPSRPRFASLSICLPSTTTIVATNVKNINELQQPSSSSLSTNNTSVSHLSTAPAGSHDQIADQPPSTSAEFSRNTSATNTQSKQFVTMAPITTTNFCYVPASDSLFYNNLVGKSRSATVSHH